MNANDPTNPATERATNPLEHEQRIVAERSRANLPQHWTPDMCPGYIPGRNLVRNFDTKKTEHDFHNVLKARREVLTERPYHRQMLEYAVRGFSANEIARLTGRSPHTVRNTLYQPWAREYMAEVMRKESANEALDILKEQVLPSIEALQDIASDPLTPVAIKEKVHQSFLDRVLGKAAQPILSGKIEPKKLSDQELDTILTTVANSRPDSRTSSGEEAASN